MPRIFATKCAVTRRSLWDYARNALAEGRLETVERHLADCSACRAELEALRRTQTALAAYAKRPLSAPRSDWDALRPQLEDAALLRAVTRDAARETERAPRRKSAGGMRSLLLAAMAGAFFATPIVALRLSPTGAAAKPAPRHAGELESRGNSVREIPLSPNPPIHRVSDAIPLLAAAKSARPKTTSAKSKGSGAPAKSANRRKPAEERRASATVIITPNARGGARSDDSLRRRAAQSMPLIDRIIPGPAPSEPSPAKTQTIGNEDDSLQ